jgi:hypothetical protein
MGVKEAVADPARRHPTRPGRGRGGDGRRGGAAARSGPRS